MDHQAHWPLSLLTSGLLSQLLSLSACLIAPKTRNFGSCLTKWKLFQQGQKSLDAVEGETHKTYKTNNVHKSRLYWLIWLTYLSNLSKVVKFHNFFFEWILPLLDDPPLVVKIHNFFWMNTSLTWLTFTWLTDLLDSLTWLTDLNFHTFGQDPPLKSVKTTGCPTKNYTLFGGL